MLRFNTLSTPMCSLAAPGQSGSPPKVPSTRDLLGNPWAVKALGLTTIAQASEVMRDVCLMQATSACIGGQAPGVALAGLAVSLAIPQLVKPARCAAQKRWQAHSQQAANQAFNTSLSPSQVSSNVPLANSAQRELRNDLRRAMLHSVNLATEATEGLCSLIGQGCILGASPGGKCVVGALLMIAVGAILVSRQADGQYELLQNVVLDDEASTCIEMCDQIWNDRDNIPGNAARVDECTQKLARLSNAIRRHDSVKWWTLLIGRGLAVMPVLISMHTVFLSHGVATATHLQTADALPATIDTVEECRILLHLAIWLPLAAHHISYTRRLQHGFKVRVTQHGTHVCQPSDGDT